MTKAVANKVDNAFEKPTISGLQRIGFTTPTSQINSPVLPFEKTFTANSQVLPPGDKQKAKYDHKKGKKEKE